jgi:hypothetical protein
MRNILSINNYNPTLNLSSVGNSVWLSNDQRGARQGLRNGHRRYLRFDGILSRCLSAWLGMAIEERNTKVQPEAVQLRFATAV